MNRSAEENILRWYIAAMAGWAIILYSLLHWWLRFSLELVGIVFGFFAVILTFAFSVGNLTRRITDPRLRVVARVRWGMRMILFLGLVSILYVAWFAHAKADQSWFVASFESIVGGSLCTAAAWLACRATLRRITRDHRDVAP
jgi:hypothetical protein